MSRNARKIQLPQKFADKLLQCEIQYKLNDPPSKQIVKSLIQLYSQGVQYYESIRSHKYLYFQLKMNQIFMSAATMSALNNNTPSEQDSPIKKKLRSEHEEQKIQALQIKQKQQKLFQQVAANTSQTATATTVKQMINQNEIKGQQTKQKLKKQLTNQDHKLKEKLQKRKIRINLSKSFSSAGMMGQAETQDTLFKQVHANDHKQSIIKPIQVTFGNVIKQDQSDDEDQRKIKRRISISQDPTKKFRQQGQPNSNINKKS